MSQITQLASGAITATDTITVELGERDGMPALVKITWPLHPTVIDPKSFGDSASIVVRLFSTAHIELAHLKSRRHL